MLQQRLSAEDDVIGNSREWKGLRTEEDVAGTRKESPGV